jgi:hypothetical protein
VHVLHLFEHAWNLANERGQVLGLVASPEAMGPFGILVEKLARADGLSRQSLPGKASHWRSIIDPSQAQVWDPRPAWDRLRARWGKHPGNSRRLIDLFQAYAPEGSLAPVGPLWSEAKSRPEPFKGHPSLPEGFLRAAESSVRILCAAVRRYDLEACRQAASRLAGLGGGLTPAGDDFLLGTMCASWLIFPERQAQRIGAAILRGTSNRTTRLSSAWLAAAAQGEFGVPWHRLLGAIASGDIGELEPAARALLSTGHTSGADALAGFLSLAA